MVKKYKRVLKKGFIVNTSRRGQPALTPEVCVERWCNLTRAATNRAECLAEKACKAAAQVLGQVKAPTRQQMLDAGKLLLRDRKCSQVLLSHIFHREDHSEYDSADSYYNMIVPWCQRKTPMRDVMKCSSVHSCFHIARSGGALKVDPLTKEVHGVVRLMAREAYSSDEQLKAAALVAYTTSTDVARDFMKSFRLRKDIAVAVRERSSRLSASGYKCFLGSMEAGQPHRNRHQGALNGECIMALLLRLDREVANGKINIFQLEDCINSDLMYPHVCDILMGLGFVTVDGPLETISSTNVALIHQIYCQLGDAPASRKVWLQGVSDELLQLIDDAVPDSKAHARFLADVRAQITGMSVAWNICKLGTVINVALGGQAKLRKNRANPIEIARKILRKLG